MLPAETERVFHDGLRPEGTELNGSLDARMKLDSFGQLEQHNPAPNPRCLRDLQERVRSQFGPRLRGRKEASVFCSSRSDSLKCLRLAPSKGFRSVWRQQ